MSSGSGAGREFTGAFCNRAAFARRMRGGLGRAGDNASARADHQHAARKTFLQKTCRTSGRKSAVFLIEPPGDINQNQPAGARLPLPLLILNQMDAPY